MSYDINFWKQATPCDAEPQDVYARLCAGDSVPGLAALPVESILSELQTSIPQFDPAEESPLASFESGSIEFSWSDQHFRFDLRGNVPAEHRNRLIRIMAKHDCPMYDPQLDERYDSADGTQVGELPLMDEVAAEQLSLLQELKEQLLGQIDAAMQGEGGMPPEITLEKTDANAFDDEEFLNSTTREAESLGYKVIGDFAVMEMPIVFRALYRAPSTFACVTEHAFDLRWSEIVVCNKDETAETWTNVPESDDLVPPWSTKVVEESATFTELHQMMLRDASGKSADTISTEAFPELFCDHYAREVRWRMEQ